MKKIAFAFLMSIVSNAFAQYETYSKTYTTNSRNEFSDIIKTNDDNILSVGRVGDDIILLKTDLSGNEIWSKSYATSQLEYANAVVELTDSGFVVVATSRTPAPPITYEGLIMRLDKNGDLLWSKHIDFAESFQSTDIMLSSDNFLYVAGETTTSGLHDLYLVKMDIDGNISWAKQYDFTSTSDNYTMTEAQDGGIVVSGTRFNTYLAAIKVDNLGVVQWSNYYSVSGGKFFNGDIVSADDGGLVIAGYVTGVGAGGKDVGLLKVDASGDGVWFRTYGGFYNEEAASITKSENSFLVSGYTSSYGDNSKSGVLMLVNNAGEVINTTVHQSAVDVECKETITLPEGGYVFCGTQNTSNLSNSSFWISRTNNTGTTSCDQTQVSLTENSPSISKLAASNTITSGSSESTPTITINTVSLSETTLCENQEVEAAKFQRIFGNGHKDQGESIRQTPDGGYIVVGNTENGPFGQYDILLLKLTDQGDTSWTKVYGGDGNDYAYDITLTNDGGYLLCGSSNSSFATEDVLVVKVNPNGDVDWTKTYEGSVANSIIKTSDGGYALAVSNNPSSPTGEARLLKIEANGDIDWYQYTGAAGTQSRAVIESQSGDFILLSDNNSISPAHQYVTRFNASGGASWTKKIAGIGSGNYGKGIIETPDGDLIIAGQTKDYAVTFNDIALIKLDKNGAFVWAKSYDNAINENANDIILSTNGFVITGFAANAGLFMGEFDLDGNNLWMKKYGIGFGSLGNGVIKALDNGYIIAATTDDFTNGAEDMYIIKTDASGNSTGCFEGDLSMSNATFTPTVSSNTITITAYTLEFNDVLNSSSSLQLALDLSINAEANVSHVSCNGFNDGEIDLSVTGGFLPLSYSWSNSETSEDITGLDAGTYIVTITDNKSCVLQDTVDVDEPEILLLTTSSTDVSCNDFNDGTATATPSGGTPPYSYQWNTGQQDSTATELLSGIYAVNVFDANGCIASGVKKVNQPAVLRSEFTGNKASCGMDDGTLLVVPKGGNAPYFVLWNTGATTFLLSNIPEGEYSVTVTDDEGCVATDSGYLETGIDPTELCLVTVDEQNQNLLVWEKPNTTNISGYNIYRNVAGVYTLIDFHPYDSLSQYADLSFGVNPQVTSYRYKISTVDTCGNESNLSDFHETIHLTSNVGIDNEVNLIWDDYEGFSFSKYYILRDSTETGNYHRLDSVSKGNFTYSDLNPPSDSASYVIEVIPNSTCISTKANHNSTRGNVSRPSSTIFNAIDEKTLNAALTIFPNPTKDMLSIHQSIQQEWNYLLTDITGKTIERRRNIVGGKQTIDMSSLNPGFYLLEIEVNNYTVSRKVVKK